MDIIMAIIFFIMFLIILGILIYFIYDYITYKQVVDDTVIYIRDVINTSNQVISSSIKSNKNYIERVDSNLSKNLQDEQLRNDRDNENITTLQNNLNKFDTNLKRFFQFTKNDVPISDKLFEHQFDADANNSRYKLNLLQRVNAATGITINEDMKICNSGSGEDCMKFKVDDTQFLIAPEASDNNIKYMQIAPSISGNNRPLASFGFKSDKGVYFGGSNKMNAGAYYEQAGSGSFNINENNMRFNRNSGGYYTIPDLKEGVSNIINLVDQLNMQNSEEHHKMLGALSAINEGMYSAYSNVEVLASYSLTFDTLVINGVAGTTKSILTFNVITLQDIYPFNNADGTSSTSIELSVHANNIFANRTGADIKNTGSTGGPIRVLHSTSSGSINANNITMARTGDVNPYITVTIGVNNMIPKHSTFSVEISNRSDDMFGIGSSQRPLSGMLRARVINNNYPADTYLPNRVNSKYSTFGNTMGTNPYFYPVSATIRSEKQTYKPMIDSLKTPFNAS